MKDSNRSFPIVASLVLLTGLLAIGAIIGISFSPGVTSYRAVNNVEQVKDMTEQYLARTNPNLGIEEIMEFSNNFYVIAQEKSTGINAFELLIDKSTGRLGLEPGPNMMWNQKYGHMGMVGTPTETMPITADVAVEYATRWVDSSISEGSVEEPKAFYGYYSMDVSRNDRIIGMLSVNGYTGDVWYHTWHGEFVRMEEHQMKGGEINS